MLGFGGPKNGLLKPNRLPLKVSISRKAPNIFHPPLDGRDLEKKDLVPSTLDPNPIMVINRNDLSRFLIVEEFLFRLSMNTYSKINRRCIGYISGYTRSTFPQKIPINTWTTALPFEWIGTPMLSSRNMPTNKAIAKYWETNEREKNS
jgi:hypothetical protein